MHFLFERAGFNRWYPAMAGKRTQAVMHNYLLEAADGIQVRATMLSERLYVPEPVHDELKNEIAQRRQFRIAIRRSPEDDVAFKMALVLGEYKREEASPLGRKVWLKHMPDAPLLIDAKAWARIERVYGSLPDTRDTDTKTKLRVMIRRPDLCQARAYVPDRHRQFHADHEQLDSHRGGLRGRSDSGVDRTETSLCEAAA